MFLDDLINQPLPLEKDYINQTLNWFPSDTEEIWLYHLYEKKDKTPYQEKILDYYKKHPVSYRLNNFGYRTDYDFVEGDTVNVFLGCSWTFGIGVNFEDTWVYKVNEDYNLPIVNLGIGGSSINTAYRQLYYFKDYFKIKNIFHFQPKYCRFEYFYNKKVRQFIIDDDPRKGHPVFSEEYLTNVIMNDATIKYNYQVHLDAIQNVANSINCNYYNIDEVKVVDYGRDLGHFGPKTHSLLASKFKKLTKGVKRDLQTLI